MLEGDRSGLCSLAGKVAICPDREDEAKPLRRRETNRIISQKNTFMILKVRSNPVVPILYA